MSLDTDIETAVVSEILDAFETANLDTPVRRWSDNTASETDAQVIVQAETSDVTVRDGKGQAKAFKISLYCTARTYEPDDKDLAVNDALYAAMESALDGLTITVTGYTIDGVVNETPKYSLVEKFMIRTLAKSLFVSKS